MNDNDPFFAPRKLRRDACLNTLSSNDLQSSPLDGLHGAHRRPDLLPRPATKERGEGWGEGLPPVAYLADSAISGAMSFVEPKVHHVVVLHDVGL